MDRTYVVTGTASGIGAATAHYLLERGSRVIGCDLHDADVIADLATIEGRAKLVDGVIRLSGGRIDAIVANAGGGPPETMLALNFFGAVATLEGLRPMLATSPASRAVMVSSVASLGPTDPGLVEACLSMDESAAILVGGSLRQRQACVELLVPKSRGQTGMGRRRDTAERGRARLYRHAGCCVHPVGSRKESDGGSDGADARRISRSSWADGRPACVVRKPGKFADDGTNPVCRWWR